MRTGRYKLIFDEAADAVSLFDLESDPNEYLDIAVEQPERTKELQSYLAAYFERNARRPALIPELAPLDEDIRKKLESLGYLSH